MFHLRPYNDLFINKIVTRWSCKKDLINVWFLSAVYCWYLVKQTTNPWGFHYISKTDLHLSEASHLIYHLIWHNDASHYSDLSLFPLESRAVILNNYSLQHFKEMTTWSSACLIRNMELHCPQMTIVTKVFNNICYVICRIVYCIKSVGGLFFELA